MKSTKYVPLSSQDWFEMFTAKKHQVPLFDWEDSYLLSNEESRRISSSIQQFELGENAQGRHFLRTAHIFAQTIGDTFLPLAIQAFIEEEQRHSRFLRRFMKAQNIPVLQKHWVDGTFRRLRKFAGLHACVVVLVTAEIIAIPYYRGLLAATESPVLRQICRQILRDEATHLAFQADTLQKLRRQSPRVLVAAIELLHYLLMLGTSLIVWREHGKVIRCADYTLPRFIRSNLRTLSALNRRAKRWFPAQGIQGGRHRSTAQDIANHSSEGDLSPGGYR